MCVCVCQELDALVSEWGDLPQHTPLLLVWTIFKFVMSSNMEITEETRLLGNKALHGNVFGFLLSMLQSPYLSKERVHLCVCVCVLSFHFITTIRC